LAIYAANLWATVDEAFGWDWGEKKCIQGTAGKLRGWENSILRKKFWGYRVRLGCGRNQRFYSKIDHHL
jgi:hypothetical protein